MDLYTIQGRRHWQEALHQGVLSGGPFLYHVDEDWRPAYQWMKKQMRKRLPWFSGDSPVWAWHGKELTNWAPDQAWGDEGEEMVLLRFQVPETRVLISDFDAWHFALSNTHLFDMEEENQEAIETSWEAILSPETLPEDLTSGRIQLCVDRVFPSEVKEVIPFVCT